MHAGRRLAQIVELEGMREGAVGKGRARRAGAAKARAEHRAGTVADMMDIVGADPAPRHRRAEQHDACGIDDAGFGDGDGRRRNVLVAQAGRELRQCFGLTRHDVSACSGIVGSRPYTVMPALVAGIHTLCAPGLKTWMAGSSPAMTA